MLRDASSGWLLSVLQAAGAGCTCAGPTGTTMTETQERGEGGGSHLSPYREQETQPDQARHGRSQQKQAHSKYLSESEKVDKHFLGDCQE